MDGLLEGSGNGGHDIAYARKYLAGLQGATVHAFGMGGCCGRELVRKGDGVCLKR